MTRRKRISKDIVANNIFTNKVQENIETLDNISSTIPDMKSSLEMLNDKIDTSFVLNKLETISHIIENIKR